VDAYVDIYVKGICESNNSEASYETYRDMYPVPVPKDTYSLFESGVFLEYDYDNYDPYNYSYIKKEGNCVLELSKPICHKTYGTTIGSTAYPFPVYKYNFKFRDWATDDRYAYHLGGNWHDDNADGMMEAPEGWGCGGSYDIDVSINEV
jgi:hypothetical protein